MHVNSALFSDMVDLYIKKVLHSAVWIEKGSSHCTVDVGSGKAHAFHVGHRCITL